MPQVSPTATAGTQKLTSEYVFQYDVRLVGVICEAVAIITDAQLNADGRDHVYTEVTRAGSTGKDGIILRAEVMSGWTAAIVVGDGYTAQEQLFFPEGMGIDFDEGETINLFCNIEAVGAVAGIGLGNATLYFVKR